jgi:hypothetical protein
MKCSVCGEPVEHGGMAIALFHEDTFILTLCPIDVAQVFTSRILRRLKRMSGRHVWVQPPLLAL